MNSSKLIPGPASYEVGNRSQRILKKNPDYSFSKEKKFGEDLKIEKSKIKIPGPGAYDSEKIKKNFRGGKFTNASRDNSNNSLKIPNPGPGAYDQTISHLHQSGKCRIGQTTRFKT